MKICPKCGREFERLLALSRVDNETMICDDCGTMEELDSLFRRDTDVPGANKDGCGGNGNKWVMENFKATHN